ncbi:hypothetical protein QZH41_002667 [Actinostola sp. cb2023]|nr:hypothetical protein QZH41_002667 [Actinostola sp. cb2023]
MSSSSKKGKAALVEFEYQTKELRQLLSDQLKLFDARMEGKVWFLADLQEYYKRMSELESDYSRNLEKIAERFNERLSKFKSQSQQHQQRYSENKRKSVKAKNEYIMYLQASNKFLQTYFNKNLSDLIDVFQISPQQLDIVDHHCDLFRKLQQIKAETDEIQKTAEATSDALKNMYKQWDNEMIKMASGQVEMSQGMISSQSIKNSCEELELYYVSVGEGFVACCIPSPKCTMGDVNGVSERRAAYHKQLAIDTKSPRAAAILDSVQKKTKIFGCNMSEYLKITGRQIPEVVESCIRFIKKFGLDHPGIFRLSGSTTDINDMKQLFEAGRDPLAGLNHWKDINAVAGLLRVYFRELDDSLFPKSHYQQFLQASSSLDRPYERMVAEHHEQNKMDAHNLAVVFGPTLLRIPSEQDMIAYQSHVNGMMEIIIKYPDQIFPGESDVDSIRRLSETEDSDSDEDFEPRDAEALYDYSARSAKELSFRKGDVIRVFKRFNKDWWDGTLNETDGFVPATYIKLSEVDSDHVPLSPTGDGIPKSSSVISPGDYTVLRPKDSNGPPRIPKREGSLKKRFDAPIRADRGSPVGPSPLPPTSETRPSPQTSTPFGTKQGFRIAISTDDILNKQKHLRALHKDDPAAGDNNAEETSMEETPKCSTLPRNHGSPLVSTEDLSKATDDKDNVLKKNDNDKSFEKRVYSLDLDKTSDESKSIVWQVREVTPTSTKLPETPPSPRSSFGPRVPPAVKPKPKGGRGPNPPSRVESGTDLLASIHAAQAARTHRTSTGEKGSPEERRRSRGSLSDDTQLYLIYTLSKEKYEFRNDKPVTYESALFSGHSEQIAGSIGPHVH